jgi:uncharacterized membrane protein
VVEEFLLAVLVIAVLWLIVRQAKLADVSRTLEEQTSLIKRLEQRLHWLEDAARTKPEPSPQQPVVQPEPTRSVVVRPEPPAVHIPPLPAVPATAAQAPPRYIPKYVPPPAAAPPPPAPPPSPPAFTPARSLSIEERLGQNWLNKLGIVILVIGLALFLGYQLRTLGPLGKSLIGFALALVLLIGGLLLERRATYRIFARAAIGGGWALTFFVTFALYHLPAMQVLQSQTLDLVLMFLVAAAMVAHSLHYKSQVVTSLAFLLAFVTVGISEITLFSLVAGVVLALGLVVIAAREFWFELGLAGVIGVYVNHFLWLHRVLPNGGVPGHPFPEFFASAALLLTYWLIFRLFFVLRAPRNREQQLVSCCAAILNSMGLMSLLKFQSAHPEWAFLALLALGAAELLLAFIARRIWRGGFLVLACIGSMLLLAAIPFHFSGSRWSVLWLFEAEILFLAGIGLREVVFRRLGLLAGLAALVQVFAASVSPIFDLRQSQPDTSLHLPVAIALFAAAALFWSNAELLTRRFRFLTEPDPDRAALILTSFLAAVALWAGIWIIVPGAWTIVLWLVAALALGLVADKLSSADLATQADLFAIAAIVRSFVINLESSTPWHGVSTRAITLILAAVLLYLGMRRNTRAHGLIVDYIPAAYSWAATALLAILIWYELHPIAIAVAWGVLGLVLFELGLLFRRNFLRHQAYALLAASFVRIFFANLNLEQGTHVLNPRLYTVIPLLAGYVWIYERIHLSDQANPLDRAAAVAFSWAAAIAAAALLYVQVRPGWVGIAWAALAFVLLALAALLRRELFVAQSLTALLAAAIYVGAVNFFSFDPDSKIFTNTRLFCVGTTCAVLFLCLPAAFRVRAQARQRLPQPPHGWRTFTLHRPEQPFFFIPLLLLTILLAVQLRAGMITIGFSALGVLTFLFALTVKERSYRLAGLALLLLGVAKILCIDIWAASPSDRYITLIVMGAALLLVSFLYSRYRETLLKFL